MLRHKMENNNKIRFKTILLEILQNRTDWSQIIMHVTTFVMAENYVQKY